MLSRHLFAGLLVSLSVTGVAFAQHGPAGWRPVFTDHVPKDKLKAAFPAGATTSGEAELGCFAAEDGRLTNCQVLKENPVGQGFGQAALSVVGYERIKKKDDAGASVAGRPVRTGFEFLAPGDANPNWIRKPSGEDMALSLIHI